MTGNKGTKETGRGGFETRPYRVAQGVRSEPEKRYDVQASIGFP